MAQLIDVHELGVVSKILCHFRLMVQFPLAQTLGGDITRDQWRLSTSPGGGLGVVLSSQFGEGRRNASAW